MKPKNATGKSLLITLLFAALTSGCATVSPTSAESFPPPLPMPSARQPQPPLSYSASAQMKLNDWHKRLTDTQQTPAH